MLEQSATLYFGPWYRRSPSFDATRRAGCTAYDIYNHMYLPGYYDDPDVEYRLLNEGVTMWDVGVERTVEVSGPDADKLIDMITCRDLTKCKVKQGKYMLVTAPDGGIVNDPVLLHVDENRWWMQLADSDAGLYALGVLAASGLNAKVTLPDVHPMQVQGPLSAKTLEKLVGSAIYDIKYYWCENFTIDGIPVLISRTGWTAIPGFEVNLLDYSRGDDLWDAVAGAGEEFGIKPIAPCEARRIEGGIFNYGSDMTLNDTPLHVMGLERLVEDQPQDYIGKKALEELQAKGVDRKLVASISRATSSAPSCRGTGTSSATGRRSGTSPTPCGRRASSETSGSCGCRSTWRTPARSSRSRRSTARRSRASRLRSRSSTHARRRPRRRWRSYLRRGTARRGTRTQCRSRRRSSDCPRSLPLFGRSVGAARSPAGGYGVSPKIVLGAPEPCRFRGPPITIQPPVVGIASRFVRFSSVNRCFRRVRNVSKNVGSLPGSGPKVSVPSAPRFASTPLWISHRTAAFENPGWRNRPAALPQL